MTKLDDITTAIIIPARNEAERIGRCLRRIGAQAGPSHCAILVVNGTTDSTIRVARKAAATTGLALQIIECGSDFIGGVGAARRTGCSWASRRFPGITALLTTDADCIVARNWIARSLMHLSAHDAVCGRVEPIADEAGILAEMDPVPAKLESDYRQLVLMLYRHYCPDSANPGPHHGETAGASLAISRAAYESVGGFRAMSTGEDCDLIRRLKRSGRRVIHAEDVVVKASCRLVGRADGGMAEALRDRLQGSNYLVGDGLPRADWLLAAVRDGGLGVWPPDVAVGERLQARDLGSHITALRDHLNTLGFGQGIVSSRNAASFVRRESRRPKEISASPAPLPSGPSLTLHGKVLDDPQGSGPGRDPGFRRFHDRTR